MLESSKRRNNNKLKGPAGIWTRIVGFKVQSANRYTTGPIKWSCGVSIPVPDACKAPTLPIELQPLLLSIQQPQVGIEPTTFRLLSECSANWAIVALLEITKCPRGQMDKASDS